MTKSLGVEYIVSLSSGTMRTEDLLPTFLEFLEEIMVECQIVGKVQEIKREVDSLDMVELSGYGEYYNESDTLIDGLSSVELAGYILNEDVWDLLGEISPEHTSFGAHPGNGSDYGFWQWEFQCEKCETWFDVESECWECPECGKEFNNDGI